MKYFKSFLLALLLLPALAIAPMSLKAAPAILQGGDMRLEVSGEPFSIRVLDTQGKALLESEGPVSFTEVTGQKISRFVLWWNWTRGHEKPWTKIGKVVAIRPGKDNLEVDLGSDANGPALIRLKARFINPVTLRVETEILGQPDVNRLRFSFKRDKSDRFYGMGERFNSVEQSGNAVRVWAEEGGLGLFTLSKYMPWFKYNLFPKGPDMTYYPMPWFINPARGFGFLLDDNHFSLFDFGKADKKLLTIENWNNRFDFLVFSGKKPLDIIEAQTAITGRITPPQPWVFAPMNAAVEGEKRVYEVAKLLRAEKIPTSAIWSEDWWWRTEWEVNRERYPHYEKMIADLHADGFRHLGYYQPYISTKTEDFKEGDQKGYFTKNRQGKTYAFNMGNGIKAQLDVTNPAAIDWWKNSFFKMSENFGVDGWMHDFGEHTPPDSISFDGRTGWDLHNDYSLLWAKAGREFWDQARPDGNYMFYIRGGYTGSQKYASVMWTGDQNSNFEKLDGLPSNLPGIMSVGMSGHPIVTTDIAGYNCFVSKNTDRELFMRWTELGALLPVMRLHRGNDEICNHWSFDQDKETLEHYKTYATLHTALFPYIYTLVFEAAEKGWPVARHLMLQYPDDPETWLLDYQFLLGDRVLVAPVLQRDAREWEVYYPEGEWAHWWTGKIYKGPGRAKVPANLGEVPMFVRIGKILPVFDSQIDTLVKIDKPGLKGWDEANSSIRIIFYGIGIDDYTLWDGTHISCARPSASATGSCKVDSAPVKRKYSFKFY